MPHSNTLEGKIWSHKMEKWVWYTSEAAKYPAIRGMLNPDKPVARLKAWQKLGAQLRILLDRALEGDDTIPYVSG